MAGVDLNLGSAGGGGSSAVQQRTGDPVAGALQGAGRTLLSVGVSNIAANRKREEAAAKATAALEKERQTIFDSSKEAETGNKIDAANLAIKATMEGNRGDTALWQETGLDTWDEIFKGFESSTQGMSEKAIRTQREDLVSARQASLGALNIAIVGAEVEAKNSLWMGRAQSASDNDDKKEFDHAVGQIDFENDGDRNEFSKKTWQKGRYIKFNDMMLELTTPDDLNEFVGILESTSEDDLSKSNRIQISRNAKQRAIKIQDRWNRTLSRYNIDLKNGVELDRNEIDQDIEDGRISAEMASLLDRPMAEMAEKASYKADYDRDRFSITYLRKSFDILDAYLDPDKSPENPELSSKEFKKMVEEIDKLKLGEWAKNDLYALAFEASTEALRQPDHSWGFGMVTVPMGLDAVRIPSVVRETDVSDDERDFRLSYTGELQTIMKQGKVVMPGLLEQFIANDVAITKAFADGAPSDVQKAMEDLLRPMINGMMNAELKRKMAGETQEAPAQTATNQATGEKLILKDGKWVPFE